MPLHFVTAPSLKIIEALQMRRNFITPRISILLHPRDTSYTPRLYGVTKAISPGIRLDFRGIKNQMYIQGGTVRAPRPLQKRNWRSRGVLLTLNERLGLHYLCTLINPKLRLRVPGNILMKFTTLSKSIFQRRNPAPKAFLAFPASSAPSPRNFPLFPSNFSRSVLSLSNAPPSLRNTHSRIYFSLSRRGARRPARI